jgi:AbiU2
MQQMETRALFSTLRAESESTIRALYALEQYHILCSDQTSVAKMNQNARFWLLFQNALTVKLFIGIRRLFENGRGTFNFQSMLDLVKKRITEFQPEAIERRKVAELPWLNEYRTNVHGPNEEDFNRLAKLVRPFKKKMCGVYTTIASEVFAHAVHTEEEIVNSLLSKTNFKEVEDALNAIWHFYDQLWQMYENGKEPSFVITQYPYADEVRKSVTRQLGVQQ